MEKLNKQTFAISQFGNKQISFYWTIRLEFIFYIRTGIKSECFSIFAVKNGLRYQDWFAVYITSRWTIAYI